MSTPGRTCSLGVILYELLTDTLPLEAHALRAQGIDKLRQTIREVDPPRPSTRVTTATGPAASPPRADLARLARQLRGDLDWITMKALEKDRTRRYGSVSDLAADLRRHLEDVPVLASPPSVKYRLGKFARRHRAGVATAAALILLLVSFAATMAVQSRRIAGERDRANREAEAARQVSNFLIGLFNVSDPSESRGNSLTARAILDKGARDIDQKLAGQPQVQARLQATVGTVYTNLGLHTAAEPLLQRAVATDRRLLGEDDSDTLAAVHALANEYWYLDRFQDAAPLYVGVMEPRRRLLGKEHPDTLRTAYDLASTYAHLKRMDEAERLYLSVLESQRRVLGEDHTDTLQTLSNLSSLYWKMGRCDWSLPLVTRAAELQRRASGADHPGTLEVMHNLATTYEALKRYDEAEAVFLTTIDGKRVCLRTVIPPPS